jgi:signal transduction histidine kinase
MAAAIAHRFNNAMTGVQGNLELLTLNLSTNSKEYTMGTDAFRGAKEASQVGSIMLSYVGQQPLQSKEVSLAELVRSTVTNSPNLFHPQVNVTFIPPQQPLYCSVDRLQINEPVDLLSFRPISSLC